MLVFFDTCHRFSFVRICLKMNNGSYRWCRIKRIQTFFLITLPELTNDIKTALIQRKFCTFSGRADAIVLAVDPVGESIASMTSRICRSRFGTVLLNWFRRCIMVIKKRRRESVRVCVAVVKEIECTREEHQRKITKKDVLLLIHSCSTGQRWRTFNSLIFNN